MTNVDSNYASVHPLLIPFDISQLMIPLDEPSIKDFHVSLGLEVFNSSDIFRLAYVAATRVILQPPH